MGAFDWLQQLIPFGNGPPPSPSRSGGSSRNNRPRNRNTGSGIGGAIGRSAVTDPVTGDRYVGGSRYHEEPRFSVGGQQGPSSSDAFLELQRQLIEREHAQELEDISSGNFRLQQQYQQNLDVYNNLINTLKGQITAQEQFRGTGQQTIDQNTDALQQLLQGNVGRMDQAYDSNLSNLTQSFGQTDDALPQFEQQIRESYATDPTFQALPPEAQQAFLNKALEEVAFAQQQQETSQQGVLGQLQELVPQQQALNSQIPQAAPFRGQIASQVLNTNINEQLSSLMSQLQEAQLQQPLEPEYGDTDSAELRYDSQMLDLMRQLASSQEEQQNPRYRGLEGVMQFAQSQGVPNLANEYLNMRGTAGAEALNNPQADDDELLAAAIMGYEPNLPQGVRSNYVQLLQILDSIFRGQFSNYG